MQLARTSLTLLIILFVLPWGAYAGGSMMTSKPNFHRVGISSAQICSLTQEELVVGRKGPAQVTLEKKCSTLAHLGSFCGPDRALPETTETTLIRHLTAEPFFTTVWRVRGRSVAPSRGPPRLF